MNAPAQTETATLAGGCFWCIEEIFRQQPGVIQVRSGYIGGRVPHPTYQQVCEGDTGHAEAVEVTFDPQQVSYGQLLDVFWTAHDPTQLNRQGNDIGPQYRSAIFPQSPAQAAEARAAIARAQADWPLPIVTTLEPAAPWYVAEDEHQEYFDRVGDKNPYCTAVVSPKVRKFMQKYGERLKSEA